MEILIKIKDGKVFVEENESINEYNYSNHEQLIDIITNDILFIKSKGGEKDEG